MSSVRPDTFDISSTWRLATPGCTKPEVTWIMRPRRANRLRPSSHPPMSPGSVMRSRLDATDCNRLTQWYLANENQPSVSEHTEANEPPPIRQLPAPELKALLESGVPILETLTVFAKQFASEPYVVNQKRCMMRRPTIAAVVTLALLSTAAVIGQSSDARIDGFFTEFTADWVRTNPNLATSTRYF